MPYLDKEKNRKYQREFLHRKKRENTAWHAAVKRSMRHKRATNRDIVAQIKKHLGCLLCEEDDPDKLQFHHVLREFKTATVADMLSNRSKLIKVINEIDKCVCVCSACHKKLGASVEFLKATLKNERWVSDWGVVEALDWLSSHPQSRLRKGNFLDVLKGVLRNCQMQDLAKFVGYCDTCR
jgi:hypothetical protein